jgi:hypothetical protein
VDKETNAIYLDAGLQAGDSGSPVLDSNGDVLGMVWGANSKKNGEGAAVRVQTLKLAAVDVVDTKVAAAQSQAKITPRAVPRAKLVDPRSMADIAKAANDKIFFSGVHLGMTIDECVTYYDKIADGGVIEHSGAPSEELANFCKWVNRLAIWDVEAIALSDDALCAQRRLKATRQLRTFCETLIQALETRLLRANGQARAAANI